MTAPDEVSPLSSSTLRLTMRVFGAMLVSECPRSSLRSTQAGRSSLVGWFMAILITAGAAASPRR